MKTTLELLRQLPVIGWVTRYWLVLGGLTLLIYAYMNGHMVLSVRAVMLVPIFILMVIASGTFASNLLIRGVTGSFRRDKDKFTEAFNACTPFQKILICKAERWLIFLIGGLIAASTLILVNINVVPL